MISKKLLIAAITATVSCSVNAGTFFEPLTAPNTNTDADSYNNNPFTIPENFSQSFVASRETLAADFAAKGETYPATFGNWDMLDFGGQNSEFIYIPHEVGDDAGVTRLNRDTGEVVVLLRGIPGSDYDTDPTDGWDHTNDNFGGLDPATVTPTGTLLTAEEWAGGGRIFELANPTTATSAADAQWTWLSNIPSVSHEGLKFDKAGNLYFVDENNSGSIYKFVPSVAGIYTQGQTFVLSVDAFTGDASANYNPADTRTGYATWVALTDASGTAAAPGITANPFDFTNRGGRAATDEINGTPYGRPEDVTMTIANGNEYLLFATTSENIVYGIELLSNETAMVREFMNSAVTPDLLGNYPVGAGSNDSSYGLDDPDNLATDAAGNIYIIEDENPGDIWQAVDADKNGVAEHVALFAGLGKYGSEPTGFKVDPRDPMTFYVNVQHPSAHNNNDSLWVIKHDVTESCDCQSAKSHGKYVSCVAHAARDLGIKGDKKDALMDLAASSNCGK